MFHKEKIRDKVAQNTKGGGNLMNLTRVSPQRGNQFKLKWIKKQNLKEKQYNKESLNLNPKHKKRKKSNQSVHLNPNAQHKQRRRKQNQTVQFHDFA